MGKWKKNKDGYCDDFQNHFTRQNRLKVKLNQVQSIEEKLVYAEQLKLDAERLAICNLYKPHSLDCANCRLMSRVNYKMADLVFKTECQTRPSEV